MGASLIGVRQNVTRALRSGRETIRHAACAAHGIAPVGIVAHGGGWQLFVLHPDQLSMLLIGFTTALANTIGA